MKRLQRTRGQEYVSLKTYLSNRWARISLFVIIAYLISEVVTSGSMGLPIPVNLQQIALLLTIFWGFTTACRIGKFCRRFMFATGCYVAASGVSFFYADDPRIGIILFISLFVNWGFLLALCRIGSSKYGVQSVEFFFIWLVRLGILEVILGGMQVTFGSLFLSSRSSIDPLIVGGITRAIGSFRDPTYFAFFLVVCSLWIYANVCTRRGVRWNNYVLLVVFSLGIVLSGSATAFLSLAAGVSMITYLRYDLFRIIGRTFLLLLLLMFVFLTYSMLFPASNYLEYVEKKTKTLQQENFERNARFLQLVTGWYMFKVRPFEGHGYGTFDVKALWYIPYHYYVAKVLQKKWQNRRRIHMVSHVFFASLIAELGIIGILTFGLMVWSIIKGIVAVQHLMKQQLQKNNYDQLIVLSLFFPGFSAAYFVRMLGYGFRLSDSFIITFFVMGMLLADGRLGVHTYSPNFKTTVLDDGNM